MGTQPPPQKGQSPLIFGTRLLWPNGCMDQDATWCGCRPQPTQHCVRWGPSSPSPKGAQPVQLSVNVRCGQTVGWTKMRLGMEVGLAQGDFVFDGDSATPRIKWHTHTPLNFWTMSIVAKRWMDEDATWYGSRPRPRPQCTRRGPSSHKRRTAAPLFSAHVYCGHGRPSQLLLSSFSYS